ncbi:DUF3817 domain-containing protein [Fulvivirga ligni]|uniref:DUF3817 domain-containing protein n=1 Tax=Fulvivirga ligni TaxID=2904246 RepID=UPI001F2D010B|nr:DUF3817 domain-containing protein [Fulvivirga ligni]UII19631.1 DUF3817 domain-containing protein [Fulvivirga ligni]
MDQNTPDNLKLVKSFTVIAILEAISYVALLFIAMPIRHFFGIKEAVKYTGWAHGILFIIYVSVLIMCWIKYHWSFIRVILFFVASLLPIVPFIVEKRLKKEYGL